jgi:hypothetical protein
VPSAYRGSFTEQYSQAQYPALEAHRSPLESPRPRRKEWAIAFETCTTAAPFTHMYTYLARLLHPAVLPSSSSLPRTTSIYVLSQFCLYPPAATDRSLTVNHRCDTLQSDSDAFAIVHLSPSPHPKLTFPDLFSDIAPLGRCDAHAVSTPVLATVRSLTILRNSHGSAILLFPSNLVIRPG